MKQNQASSTEPWRIRRADYADLEDVLRLWARMMREHEKADARIRLAAGALAAYRSYAGYHLTNGHSRVLVAEAGGEVIAFCLMTITRNLPMFLPDRYGYLSDLYVDPAYRRRGIGRRIVAELIDWLAEYRISSVQLQYYSFNETGEAFWRSLGFNPYYTRMWLDMADFPQIPGDR